MFAERIIFIAHPPIWSGHDLLLLPGVGAIVVDDRGRLLFARRSDTGRWAVVAGMVEPGEQPADTIVREVHEETGVDVAVERILGVATHPVDYPNGDRCDYLSITFLCRATGGTARVNDDESLDVGWFERRSCRSWSLTRGCGSRWRCATRRRHGSPPSGRAPGPGRAVHVSRQLCGAGGQLGGGVCG